MEEDRYSVGKKKIFDEEWNEVYIENIPVVQKYSGTGVPI